MTADDFANIFILRLISKMTPPENVVFLDQNSYDKCIEEELEKLADFIWDQYKL